MDRLDRRHVDELDVALQLGGVGAVVRPLVAEVATGDDADPGRAQLAETLDLRVELLAVAGRVDLLAA